MTSDGDETARATTSWTALYVGSCRTAARHSSMKDSSLNITPPPNRPSTDNGVRSSAELPGQAFAPRSPHETTREPCDQLSNRAPRALREKSGAGAPAGLQIRLGR